MGSWVLIVLYMSGGYPSIGMHDFTSEQTCQAAAAKIVALQSEMKGLPQIKAICQPK